MSATTLSGEGPTMETERRERPLRRLWNAKPWMAAFFLVSSFAFGLTVFIVIVTLLATGFGLAITLIGLPILALALVTWVGAAKLERRRIAFHTGVPFPDPYLPVPKGGLWTKLRAKLQDTAVWLDLLYCLVLFSAGIVELVIVSFAVMTPFWLIVAPIFYSSSPIAVFGDSSTGTGWVVDTFPEAILCSMLGLLLVIPCCLLMIGTVKLHVILARRVLGHSRTEELEERVDVLTKSRSDVMDAMSDERRRIERDLHDGAQQRLVALAMNLGMAKEKMESDPAAAQKLVEESHEEAKLVLKELRELVRGIHPAVLTDRGLDAAVSAIAGRCPVPVTVDIHLAARLPEAIESTAYFVVSEALTNIAKHSGATRARVTVWLEDGTLTTLVWDDGAGGALISTGTGLRGLADRVSALDGRLTVESPRDGGTTVRAEIPCAS